MSNTEKNSRHIKQQIIQTGIEIAKIFRENKFRNVEGEFTDNSYTIQADYVRKAVIIPVRIELAFDSGREIPAGFVNVETLLGDFLQLQRDYDEPGSLANRESLEKRRARLQERLQELIEEIEEMRRMRRELLGIEEESE
jgi:hypothetical protein